MHSAINSLVVDNVLITWAVFYMWQGGVGLWSEVGGAVRVIRIWSGRGSGGGTYIKWEGQ